MRLNDVQCLISWLSNDISISISNPFEYIDNINGRINVYIISSLANFYSMIKLCCLLISKDDFISEDVL